MHHHAPLSLSLFTMRKYCFRFQTKPLSSEKARQESKVPASTGGLSPLAQLNFWSWAQPCDRATSAHSADCPVFRGLPAMEELAVEKHQQHQL
jgi:hypothetical protein